MLRRIAALAVAALGIPALASAADAPVADHATASVADHGSASLASAPASRPDLVPGRGVTPSLRLVWLDPAGVVVGTQAVVEPEVKKLLREMGVATEWRRGDAKELAQPGELRVIFLDRPAPREHGAPVLGSTPSDFRGAQDTPFVWVHVPSVRAAVGLRPRGGSFEDLASRRQLGIALARVIAHEVVHAVAPSLPHGGGLMSPRLDHRMLTAAPRLAPPRIVPAARPPESHGARARTPIELTVEVLHGPFRPLIVWGLFWGARPFSELMRHVPDVTKRALRRELVEMERIGLVVRDVRPDSNRRAFYSLSPFGETLRPVVGAMYEWGLLCAEPRRSREDRLRVRTGA